MISKTPDGSCAVSALKADVTVRKLQALACFPLFITSFGPFVTRHLFSTTLKTCIPEDKNVNGYSAHCFDIGAVTTAAA